MKSSPDNTVAEILYEFLNQFKEDGYLAQGNTDNTVESLDSHYLSIFLEEIDNELSMPNPLQPVTALFRLKKLRKALQDRLGGSNVTNKKEVI